MVPDHTDPAEPGSPTAWRRLRKQCEVLGDLRINHTTALAWHSGRSAPGYTAQPGSSLPKQFYKFETDLG
jgi:hypothetical protein